MAHASRSSQGRNNRKLIGRICVLALSSLLVVPTSVSQYPITRNCYSGWTGTQPSYQCRAITCNNADGCSWFTSQYNWYYPMGQCKPPVSGGGSGGCTHSLMLCRIRHFYSGTGTGCTGTLIYIDNIYQGGC
jgi:hypothetical protein